MLIAGRLNQMRFGQNDYASNPAPACNSETTMIFMKNRLPKKVILRQLWLARGAPGNDAAFGSNRELVFEVLVPGTVFRDLDNPEVAPVAGLPSLDG